MQFGVVQLVSGPFFLPIGSGEIAEGHKKLIGENETKVRGERYSIISESNGHFTN